MGHAQGTVTSVIITQAGVRKDILPTVTAVISATPNLGGVLGVGAIGTSTYFPPFPYHIS
jgi:hypothetical protein